MSAASVVARTLVWRGGPKVMVGPVGLPGAADLFFENRGDGTFVEATEARGLTDGARAYGFGVLATDYDDDGRVDLYVANDSQPNFLYHNRGGGRFESEGLLAGVAAAPVVYLHGEDGDDDTVRPRLEAAGADLSRESTATDAWPWRYRGSAPAPGMLANNNAPPASAL